MNNENLLQNWSLVHVTGADAATFLQGQLTNNVDSLSDGESQITGYCDPKGRLLAIFYLLRTKDGHYLLTRKRICLQTVKRLSMYVMRSDVKIEDITDTSNIYGVMSSAQANDRISFKISDTISIHCSNSEIKVENPLTDTGLDHQLVTHGIPVIEPETVGAFIPQWVNLELINGVSFKKGCYPGQEIVARTKYLGKLKKRAYVLKCDDEVKAVTNGDSIFIHGEKQSVGTVISCSYSNRATYIFAVMRIAATSAPGFDLTASAPTPRFQLSDMPYEITSE